MSKWMEKLDANGDGQIDAADVGGGPVCEAFFGAIAVAIAIGLLIESVVPHAATASWVALIAGGIVHAVTYKFAPPVYRLSGFVGCGLARGWWALVKFGISIPLLLLRAFGIVPPSSGADEHVRGGEIEDAGLLSKVLHKRGGSGGKIILAGVPIPLENEGKHVLVEGTTGSGKSQAIYGIVQSARERGDRGIIIDIGGAYVSRFYREGDLILNPFDARSVKWDPFAEVRREWDYKALACSIIPDGHGTAAEWHLYGQTLLSACLKSVHRDGGGVPEILRLFTGAAPEDLQPILAGTMAEALMAEGNERMLGSVRAICASFLDALQLFTGGGDFSIRRWIETAPAGQWLYITYRDAQIGMLRQMLAAWLSLAVNQQLSLDEEDARRTWFIADEFDSLGKAASIKDGLTKLRKYKGSCVLGLQTISQLRETYGHDGATTLLGNLGNKLFLRAGDPETAKYCSDDLGQVQIARTEHSSTRTNEGISNTSATRHVTEHLVMPSELSNLPDCEGYLNLAGPWPVARVTVPIPQLARVCKPFED